MSFEEPGTNEAHSSNSLIDTSDIPNLRDELLLLLWFLTPIRRPPSLFW
jgi:hypothetical protein